MRMYNVYPFVSLIVTYKMNRTNLERLSVCPVSTGFPWSLQPTARCPQHKAFQAHLQPSLNCLPQGSIETHTCSLAAQVKMPDHRFCKGQPAKSILCPSVLL